MPASFNEALSLAIMRRDDWASKGITKLRAPDLQIEEWLFELECDILARNADVGDVQHDCYVAAKCEYELNPVPNLAYIRQLLGKALSKPFATKH